MPGLCLSVKAGVDAIYGHRDLDLIFTQYRMCQEGGARGVAFYALDNTWNGKEKPFRTLARKRGVKLARKAKRWMDGFPNAVHGDSSAGKQEREE